MILSWVLSFAATTGADDEETVVNEAVVDGSAGEIWNLITTKNGMESWMVPHAEIDFRVGGFFRTHHDPKGKIGDPWTVTNVILAVTPRRMFSLQLADAPDGFPFAETLEGVRFVISLDPLERGRTRVRCVGRGFGSGPMGYAARAFVDRGNEWALQHLQKTCLARRARRT